MNHRGDFLGDLFVPGLPGGGGGGAGAGGAAEGDQAAVAGGGAGAGEAAGAQEANPEDVDMADGLDRDADGVLDGGVAGPPSGDGANAKRRSSDCDLRLLLTCEEFLEDIAPNHPILRPGVTVSIGLDKSTKLSAVFTRYADFCNEHSKEKVVESDLEFLHCQLLNGNDTAEASALMKGDRIRVRRDTTAEREKEAEHRRMQRESDREYFKQLRHLLPDQGGSRYCDVVLDCRGKLVDYESGRNQQVLSTTVRGNSVLINKRCKWLGTIIQQARDQLNSKHLTSVTILPDNDNENDNGNANGNKGQKPDSHTPAVAAESDGDDPNNARDSNRENTDDDDDDDGEASLLVKSSMEQGSPENRRATDRQLSQDEDDDHIRVLSYRPVRDTKAHHRHHHHQPPTRGGAVAAEIENDDDEEEQDQYEHAIDDANDNCRAGSPPVIAENSRSNVLSDNTLWVTLPNHSPEAVKLLLEYCYTNRVLPLGQDAFIQSCRTKPAKPNGPVSPYHQGSSSSRRWPNGGLPTVSFSVALAGISLAEEATMPRFSLMCEIAAAQLVSVTNVVEALSLCTSQLKLTGNPLARLRQAAIDIVLRAGPRGVYQLSTFRRALEERTNSIVPTLLTGTMEAIALNEKRKNENSHSGCKRERCVNLDSYFDDVDRDDKFQRERERRSRRIERWENDPNSASGMNLDVYDVVDEVYCDPVVSSGTWGAVSARHSLKRMSNHLSSNNDFPLNHHRSSSSGVHNLSESAYNKKTGYIPSRRRSRRRSSSDKS